MACNDEQQEKKSDFESASVSKTTFWFSLSQLVQTCFTHAASYRMISNFQWEEQQCSLAQSCDQPPTAYADVLLVMSLKRMLLL